MRILNGIATLIKSVPGQPRTPGWIEDVSPGFPLQRPRKSLSFQWNHHAEMSERSVEALSIDSM